jgi:hypothetical protein
MEYQRRSRKLSPDEAADLEHQGQGVFSVDELKRFEVYCSALFRIAELSGVASDGCAEAHGCSASCGRKVPAGLPIGWVRSKYDLCPACVRARKMVRWMHTEPDGALDQELLRLTPGDEQAEKAAFFSALGKIGAR